MDENNFTKGTILIVLILFMFSNKLLDLAWDISKSLLYLMLIIYCVNYLNPILGKKIKEIINDFINIDCNNNFISDLLSKLSFNILSLIKKTDDPTYNSFKNNNQENIKIYEENEASLQSEMEQVRKLDVLEVLLPHDLKLIDNRNLSNIGETNNRTLS